VTLCGVWQHLEEDARDIAIANLAEITAPGGMLVMSLRHGPGVAGRRVFPIDPDETIEAAGKASRCSGGSRPAQFSRAISRQACGGPGWC
jgi:hypothetical protein